MAENFNRPTQHVDFEWKADSWHRAVNPILYRIEEAEAIWRKVSAKVLWVGANNSFIMQHCRQNLAAYSVKPVFLI